MCSMLSYRILDARITIASEVDALSQHIECLLRPLRAADSAPPDYRLFIFDGAGGLHATQLCCPELPMNVHAESLTEAWRAFRKIYARIALGQGHPKYTLHCAAVTDANGNTGLIIGGQNAGKTCVALGLLRKGFVYVSDDYGCISLETGLLRALPVGCTVNEHIFRTYPELQPLRSELCKFRYEREWQWTIQPADLYPTALPSQLFRPTHFFFLYGDHGAKSSIKPIGPEDALWRLHFGCFTSPTATPPAMYSSLEYQERTYELARGFLEEARFFKVVNGDIRSTTDLIAAACDK